jgi:hypothetical protein
VRFFGTTWTVRNPRTCEETGCSRPVCDLEPDDPSNREQQAVHCDELQPLD